MARMVLLGVGTAVPDADRENTHMVWLADEGPLLIDCGGGCFKSLLRAGIDPLTLKGVVVTHGHADHISGLPVLLFQLAIAEFRGSLPIYGAADTLALLQRIVAAFELGRHAVAVEWRPVEPGAAIPVGAASYRLRSAQTVHPWPALALRFETASGALTYSADTEPCPAVAELAQGAQVLIHEATCAEPFEGHTTPRQAGEIALRSAVERLVLVHFSHRYTLSEPQAIAEVRAAGFQGEVSVGQEQQIIEV